MTSEERIKALPFLYFVLFLKSFNHWRSSVFSWLTIDFTSSDSACAGCVCFSCVAIFSSWFIFASTLSMCSRSGKQFFSSEVSFVVTFILPIFFSSLRWHVKLYIISAALTSFIFLIPLCHILFLIFSIIHLAIE